MSRLLPLFPLQLVCFPGEVLSLHIFEPRYKQLINEAEANDIEFGIPTFIKKKIEFGTSVKLQEIAKKYPDGKMDIRIKGLKVFKITNFIPRINGRLYSGGDIDFLQNDMRGDESLNLRILELIRELQSFMKFTKPLPDSIDFMSYDVAHYVGLSLEKEYKFLQILSEIKRQKYIIKHLEKTIPILHEVQALEEKVQMNGHFKNLIPPDIL